MAHFYVYETVDIPIKLKTENTEILKDYTEIVVSIVQKNPLVQIDKFTDEIGINVETNTLTIHLSQEETAKFYADKVAEVQVNIYYENTERDTSAKGTIDVLENLYKKQMP